MKDMLIVIGAVVLLFIGVSLLGQIVRAWVRQQTGCPEHASDFDVLFERRLNAVWDLGRPLNVLACSYFPGSAAINCRKTCLKVIPRSTRRTTSTAN